MNEPQNNPEQNLPGKAPEQIPLTQAAASSTSQTDLETDVHHHYHIHDKKKKWKAYLFEFFMLLLAIFLGFQAENFREKLSEENLEEEYVHSLIKDLKNDTALIGGANTFLGQQIQGIDTIQTLLTYDLNKKDSTIFNCYYYSTFLQLSYPVNFIERTITQLLSSGNMRLLKTSDVADYVTEYFSNVKYADIQKEMYLDNINKCIESMYKVYDITYLRRKVNNRDSLLFLNDDWTNIKFLTTDPAELKKLTTTMEITKLMVHGYKLYLGNIKIMATNLLEFLQEEYNIKEN